MAAQKTYHVRPHDDGWSVEAEGAERPTAVESRKSDAVKRGREVAENQQPSRLVVHLQDGNVQREYTYGDLTVETTASPESGERFTAADAGYVLAALAEDAIQLANEAFELARNLPTKAQDRAKELREARNRTQDLEKRLRKIRETAEKRFDEEATKGRTVVDDLLKDERVQRVLDQAKAARSQVKAAITSIRKTGDEAVSGATKAGGQQARTAKSQVKAAASSMQKTAKTAAEAGKDAAS